MTFIVFLALISFLISAQPHEQFLSWVNEKRALRLAPKLEYAPQFQERLDEVAQALEKKYCHCYKGPYYGEVITQSGSLEDCFKSLFYSNAHRKIMMKRDARRATVGIYQKDDWWYVVMRVYNK